MSSIEEIRSRRTELLARAAVERERVSVQIEKWRAPLAVADRAIALVSVIRTHPQWVVSAVALIVVLRPRRALAWARRGFVAWRVWRWIERTARAVTGAPQI